MQWHQIPGSADKYFVPDIVTKYFQYMIGTIREYLTFFQNFATKSTV